MFLVFVQVNQVGYDCSISGGEAPAGQLCCSMKFFFLCNFGATGHAPWAVVGKVGVVPSEGYTGSRLHKTQLIFKDVLVKAAELFHFLLMHSYVILYRL